MLKEKYEFRVRPDVVREMYSLVPDTYTTRGQLDRAGMHIVGEPTMMSYDNEADDDRRSSSDRATADYLRSQI